MRPAGTPRGRFGLRRFDAVRPGRQFFFVVSARADCCASGSWWFLQAAPRGGVEPAKGQVHRPAGCGGREPYGLGPPVTELADLKMPGRALEAVDGVLAQADSGAMTAGEAVELALSARVALPNNGARSLPGNIVPCRAQRGKGRRAQRARFLSFPAAW